MPSRNFHFLKHFDAQFDSIGQLAEEFAGTHPKITLIFARQMAELFAKLIQREWDISDVDITNLTEQKYANLNGRIQAIENHWPPKPGQSSIARDLFKIKDDGNDAVHVNLGQSLTYRSTDALRALRKCHDIGLWVENNCGTQGYEAAFVDPISKGKEKSSILLFTALDSELRLLEQSTDIGRQELKGQVTALRKRFRKHPKYDTLTAWQKAYLLLTLDSISYAKLGHAGWQKPAPELAPGHLEREALLKKGDWISSRHPILLLRNRWAILLSNGYFFEEAYDQIEKLIKAQETFNQQFEPSERPERDPEFGKLLGTFGQLNAFYSWSENEPEFLKEAMELFGRARAHFSDVPSQSRQDTYWGHAFVEQLRMGVEPTENERNKWIHLQKRLETDLETVIAHPFSMEAEYYPASFGAALLLKYSFVTNSTSCPIERVMRALARKASNERSNKPNWLPPNPYELILGLVRISATGGVPKILKEVVKDMTSQDNLSGFIATLYDAHQQARSENLPASFVDDLIETHQNKSQWPLNWLQYEDRLRDACKNGGPFPFLPLNFA